MRRILPTFLVAVLAIGCTARRTIPFGRYDQFVRPGVVLFTARYFHFPGADSVEYLFSSDDLSSSRHGKGRYRIAGKKLILTFEDIPPPPSLVRATTKAASGDSLHLFFRAKVPFMGGAGEPLPGLNVLVQDSARNTITGLVTAKDGTAQLKIARNELPRRVTFSFIALQSVEHPLQDSDASFDVLMQVDHSHGEVYKAGKAITFGIAKISDNQLVLKIGKDRVVFVKKATR